MVLIYREVGSSFTTRDLAVRSLLCSILRHAVGSSKPQLEFPAGWHWLENY
jgi:hypothetical protein